MFENGLLSLIVADRLAEAERLGDRARLLAPVRRQEGLRAWLGRLLGAVGVRRRSRRAVRRPALEDPGRLPLSLRR